MPRPGRESKEQNMQSLVERFMVGYIPMETVILEAWKQINYVSDE